MSGHTLPVLEVGTVRADHHWASAGCHDLIVVVVVVVV